MTLFDWQKPLWQQLTEDLGHLPHALILFGAEGLGKFAFAQALAARLLCQSSNFSGNPTQVSCGVCSSCNWLSSGNHPDLRLVQPESDTEEDSEEPTKASTSTPRKSQNRIKVEQIRNLNDFVFIGSHGHGSRVVLIHPAESMNAAASNSLLKILEEPPAGVYFILISNSINLLLPTIRSRCRLIPFHQPAFDQAQQWLAEQGVESAAELLQLVAGSPLKAANWAEQGRQNLYKRALEPMIELSDDPVAMALKWSNLIKSDTEFGLTDLIEAQQKWLYDLLLYKFSGKLNYHQAWQKNIAVLAKQVSINNLMTGYQDLLKMRAVARHPLNTQLFLEDLASRYLRLLATGNNKHRESMV